MCWVHCALLLWAAGGDGDTNIGHGHRRDVWYRYFCVLCLLSISYIQHFRCLIVFTLCRDNFILYQQKHCHHSQSKSSPPSHLSNNTSHFHYISYLGELIGNERVKIRYNNRACVREVYRSRITASQHKSDYQHYHKDLIGFLS